MARAVLGLMIVGSTCIIAVSWAFGLASDQAKDALIPMGGFTGMILTFFYKTDHDEVQNNQGGAPKPDKDE